MMLRSVHIHKHMEVPFYCSVNKDKDFEGDDLFQCYSPQVLGQLRGYFQTLNNIYFHYILKTKCDQILQESLVIPERHMCKFNPNPDSTALTLTSGKCVEKWTERAFWSN